MPKDYPKRADMPHIITSIYCTYVIHLEERESKVKKIPWSGYQVKTIEIFHNVVSLEIFDNVDSSLYGLRRTK
jgi:hypothetical protein